MTEIQLIPLEASDRERFIKDNQEAFNYGALEEFGQRDDHFEEDGELFEMFRFEKILPSTPESVQEQIKRIAHYEKIMQETENGSPELLKALSDYYSSSAWKRDYAADEAGLLPKDMKHGVLSEDSIYNLLEE